MKMKCDRCGKWFSTNPRSKVRRIFPTNYGCFCTDWGKTPDNGCWPKVRAEIKAEIKAEKGLEGNIEKYWKAFDAEEGLVLAWEKLSKKQIAIVSAEHDRRQDAYREAMKPTFDVGDVLNLFGDFERYTVMCRMRCFLGPWIQDMYYVSWKSAQSSDQDSQYEELLLIHRRRDYGQGSQGIEEVGIVCLRERTKMLGNKLMPIDQMKSR